MREILFRGQCQATKEWVYGLPITETTLSNTISHIAQFAGDKRKFGKSNVMIIPESIGQFIGLLDKNGNKIFEGDIIEEISHNLNYPNYIKDRTGVIVYYKDSSGFYFKDLNNGQIYPFCKNMTEKMELINIEIIGNIHENK